MLFISYDCSECVTFTNLLLLPRNYEMLDPYDIKRNNKKVVLHLLLLQIFPFSSYCHYFKLFIPKDEIDSR